MRFNLLNVCANQCKLQNILNANIVKQIFRMKSDIPKNAGTYVNNRIIANKESTIKTLPVRTHVPGAISHKYEVFREEDSTEILDVEEERSRYQTNINDNKEESFAENQYANYNTNRGHNGVFDINDLVEVLRNELAEDIFVCSVSKELNYVDYIVICNGQSYRHMISIAEFIRRLFKIKRHSTDLLPKIEGEKSHDWIAMDLGNIVLHIFSATTRETYDLESLWSIGSKYDKEWNKPQDPLVELFEKHLIINN